LEDAEQVQKKLPSFYLAIVFVDMLTYFEPCTQIHLCLLVEFDIMEGDGSKMKEFYKHAGLLSE
jgi:hypothetical protein